MAQIEQEIKRLDAAEKSAPKTRRRARPKKSGNARRGSGTSTHSPKQSVDDLLEQMKRQSNGAAPKSTTRKKKKRKKKRGAAVDDELAALKRKMAAKKGRKS
jgi:phage shock protein A